MKKNVLIISICYCLIFLLTILVAQGASKAITVISENAAVSDRKCIIIDPGHGGIDGGATSYTGITESTLNLQIALRLNDLIHLLGIDTVMIRDTDISVYTEGSSIAQKKISDLKNRVRIINEKENAILISIHQNHFSDSRYYGPQVFYCSESSKKFAQTMQSSLSENLCPESRRQAKKSSGVYIMQNIECVGLLVECGFISNPEEESKLRSDSYQKQLSSVIAVSCLTYLNDLAIT